MIKEIPILPLRDYQAKAWDYLMENNTRRSFFIWHRRAGKDLFGLQYLVARAMVDVGNYWYILPQQNQVRRAIWEGITSKGTRYLDLIPAEAIYKKSEQEMKITLRDPHNPDLPGSIISFLGGDRYDTLVGAGIKGCVISEYALQRPNLYDLAIQPMLMESRGWVMFNTTPRGQNHAYDMYKALKDDPEAYTSLLTIEDTGVMDLSDIEIERKRGKPEEIIQQEFYCFTPNTTVTTQRGQVKICDVCETDFVLTHTNRMRKVLRKIEHHHCGEMIRIKTYGNGKDIVCTPNHPIRVHNKEKQTYEWKKAEDITIHDRITFPRRLSGEKIVSECFARLVAWFIAEGSLSKNAVQFTLHKKETEFHKEIMDCAINLGYSTKKSVSGNTCQIYVCSTELSDKLSTMCGSGALNKRIPFEVIKGWEKEVWECLINGDGCFTKRGVWSYSTVSESLAYDMQQLSIMLGKKASITKQKGVDIIQGRKVNAHDRYSVQISNYDRQAKVNHNAIAKYCMHSEIRSITREHYDGIVYNLSVQYDESYVADGRVVHNCSWAGAIHGAYYADVLQKAEVGDFPYDPRFPVHTCWDLGVSDSMAIWFVQFINGTIRLIDYYEASTYGLGHYADVVLSKGYRYIGHHLPHDGVQRQLTPTEKAQSIQGQLLTLGLNNVDIIPRTKDVYADIQAVRGILPICRFDNKCKQGYQALQNYRREYDEDRKCFKNNPLHDWTSHGSDAFRIIPIIERTKVNTAKTYEPKTWGGMRW